MSLLDQWNLAQDRGFQERVYAAWVTAALNVVSEVASDVQTLSITGNATGGTFTLTWNGQTTAAIPFSASAGQVQLALQNLSNVGSGNVACTAAGSLPANPVTINFTGTLANMPCNAITVGTNSLTGTASPAPSLAHTTLGAAYPNHATRVALASKIVQGTGPSYFQLAVGVAGNATVQTDFPATGGYQLAVSEAQVSSDIQLVVNSVYNAYC